MFLKKTPNFWGWCATTTTSTKEPSVKAEKLGAQTSQVAICDGTPKNYGFFFQSDNSNYWLKSQKSRSFLVGIIIKRPLTTR